MKFEIKKKDRKFPDHGSWYVAVYEIENSQLLKIKKFMGHVHNDGGLYPTTKTLAGQWNGWYATREKAREAVRLYKKNN